MFVCSTRRKHSSSEFMLISGGSRAFWPITECNGVFVSRNLRVEFLVCVFHKTRTPFRSIYVDYGRDPSVLKHSLSVAWEFLISYVVALRLIRRLAGRQMKMHNYSKYDQIRIEKLVSWNTLSTKNMELLNIF